MQRLGWIEGDNLSVEGRVTGEDLESRRAAAAELAGSTLNVIVAAGVGDARAIFAAARIIPIVVVAGTDLVENGTGEDWFSLAGLWRPMLDGEGTAFTLLTTEPGPDVVSNP